MKKTGDTIELSAGDLSNHIACSHLTFLNLSVANGLLDPPAYFDPTLMTMRERGLEFEKAYLKFLGDNGLSIQGPMEDNFETSFEHTVSSMKAGVDIIYQATLKSGIWQGRADFLRKINKASNLGAWSYEVIDSKLAKETRAGTIVQLCLYSQIIAEIQGIMPECMYVFTPENGFSEHSYRIDDFFAYHRLVLRRVMEAIAKGTDNIYTYPNSISHCDICRWWQHCVQHRRTDDHLSIVAGLSNGQVSEIKKWDVHTLEQFAKLPIPIEHKPSRGAIETFERLREQARVQLEARISKKPIYEFLPLHIGKGFFNLPMPSDGDIFFDFEGDPFAGTTGIEYLFGWMYANESDERYHRLWALTPVAEKKSFEEFVDIVMSRRQQYPDLHIYHYTAYEPAAFKRLMGKYVTRENEIDLMLRAGLFIDLHSVMKQSIRAGIERYSLKELEIFHGFERRLALRDASVQLRAFETLLERNNLDNIPSELLRSVEMYNQEDCLSTKRLRNWLEGLRETLVRSGTDIPRPSAQSGQPSESITDHQQRIQPIFDALASNIPIDPGNRSTEQQGIWLLANMLDWYRIEKKSSWWEYFRLLDLSENELLEEKAAIVGLQFTCERQSVKKSFIDSYHFPPQECEIRKGDTLKSGDGENLGEVTSINTSACIIDIKKGPKTEAIHPPIIFKHTDIPDKIKEEAIIRIANWVAQNGIDGDGLYRAGRDLLCRYPPRTVRPIANQGDPQTLAVEWVHALDKGILPIQGPPGAGKSHTAAQMIVALVQAGKKIGITALSHKVIKGLLQKVIRAADEKQIRLTCIQKISEISGDPNPRIIETKENNDVLVALHSGQAQIAAGTSWLWAREDFREAVDVLFVDEAGQLSLIDTVAVSQAATNVVLLGDPQQLKQPQQGSHPEGTEVSALEHVLNGKKTIPLDRGIFLDETWRLHPNICSFISELFYENRLHSKPNLAIQLLEGNTSYRGAGLWFEPVEHTGNQSSSVEEVERIHAIITDLCKGDVYWTDSQHNKKLLTLQDILVIAPYNSQVVALISGLHPSTHIGTVDKFQGQEAAVVIFSLTTSAMQDAPRGMEFLYSLNRLNVAVSRAKVACILVASPMLFEPDCKSPHQMKLANAFCRYIELAK